LSEKLAGGKQLFYGLWDGSNQIGFLAFSNYVPHRAGTKMQLHFNRLVIHPDYCGFGLGVHFLNKCAKIVHDKDYEVMGKFSSVPVYNALKRDARWRLNTVQRKTPKAGKLMERKSGFRQDVKTWSFKYALNTI
jgi:GNAT superfamily N-acetyltransferase